MLKDHEQHSGSDRYDTGKMRNYRLVQDLCREHRVVEVTLTILLHLLNEDIPDAAPKLDLADYGPARVLTASFFRPGPSSNPNLDANHPNLDAHDFDGSGVTRHAHHDGFLPPKPPDLQAGIPSAEFRAMHIDNVHAPREAEGEDVDGPAPAKNPPFKHSATSEVSFSSTVYSSVDHSDMYDHFSIGDEVVVMKEEMNDGVMVKSTVYGETATVMVPDWNGMVKVKVLSGVHAGETKSYQPKFLG